MMLGGSPISVAVPPMFDARISVMKNGMGFTSSSLHTVSVMGPMSSTVVTLSKNADSTAVSSTNSSMTFHGSPLASRAALMARNSNMPESFTTETNSIMPRSTPSVLKSMCSMAASNGSTCRASTSMAPTMAASERCSFSVMMANMTTTNTAIDTIWLTSMRAPPANRAVRCSPRPRLLEAVKRPDHLTIPISGSKRQGEIALRVTASATCCPRCPVGGAAGELRPRCYDRGY